MAAFPNHQLSLKTGLFGDLAGTLERLGEKPLDAAVVAIEWTDLDRRLGIRSLGGWGPQDLQNIVDTVRGSEDLREQVAIATWGAEMLRRSEFASQGEAVLILWREFAWDSGRLKRDFRITARAICDAERRIVERLTVK